MSTKNVLPATLLLLPLIGVAQSPKPGQVTSGEAGYKVGCSVANSNNQEVCGETGSYQSMKKRQEAERLAKESAEKEKKAATERAKDKATGVSRN